MKYRYGAEAFMCGAIVFLALPVAALQGEDSDVVAPEGNQKDHSRHRIEHGATGVGPVIGCEQAKLVPSDGALGDYSGRSVSVSANTALVGASYHDDNGMDSGAAYIFTRNGTSWSQQAELLASDGAAGDHFGWSVSVSGDTALVGAWYDDDGGLNSGSVYVFVRTGVAWSQQAKLVASDGQMSDWFGSSVALWGNTALIGAIGDDDNGSNSGSAYVFVRNGTSWSQQAKLLASNGATGDYFGSSVSLSDDTALVGAPQRDGVSTNSGSAYVFVLSGTNWSEQAEVLASDGAASDYFGGSVSLSSDTALIGAPNAGLVAGATYVFVRTGTTWPQQAKLIASDGEAGDSFGFSASLSGDAALIGAFADDNTGMDSGSAYMFVRNGVDWSERARLLASDGDAGDRFGYSVSLSGVTALVGAYLDDDNGTDSGSAFVLSLTPVPYSYCTGGVSASGCMAALTGCGAPSESATSGFSVTATSVEGAKDGLFFFGTNGRQASPWGNGSSYQCVIPPVKRAGLMIAVGSTAGACDGSFSQDLNALWCASCPKPLHNPGAGATVQAQLWYRDPQNTSNQTTSLSDAIEFTVGP